MSFTMNFRFMSTTETSIKSCWWNSSADNTNRVEATVTSTIETNNMASLWDVASETVSTRSSTTNFLTFISSEGEEINSCASSTRNVSNVLIVTKTNLFLLESSGIRTNVSGFKGLAEDIVVNDETTNSSIIMY